MPRVFNRVSNQVAGRRRGLRRPKPGLHTTINSMYAYLLEVDAYMRDRITADGHTLTNDEENLLLAGEQLREDFKLWLE